MNSTDLYDKLMKDVLDKADRTEILGRDVGWPSASLLTRVLDAKDTEIDADIRRFTRNYPTSTGVAWKEHLVGLHPQLEQALGDGAQDMYKIRRIHSGAIYGVKMFDDLRTDTAHVRSLEAWKGAFKVFSKGILAGLDFSHVFIAGGSVLATLSEEDTGVFDTRLNNSDIDIFLYGLTDEEASKKVEDIAHALRTNITSFDERYYIERGVGVISFVPYQSSAGRKVQVVLRLAANPAEILAGFDFDQVCMGYDGTNVWMSLRGVRALCTGYTATMGALSSTFAARIIKYGSRGYGVTVGLPENDGRNIDKLNAKCSALQDVIKQRYTALPWYRTSNYKVLYHNTKGQAASLWTHSFSAMSALAGLWAVAHASGRIPELMAEVGSTQSMYGAYEGADRVMTGYPADAWTEVLQGIVPKFKKGPLRKARSIWKAGSSVMSMGALKTVVCCVVILPAQFRFFLQAAAPGVCGRAALVALHDNPTLKDRNGTKYEVCAWQIGAGNMWQPPTGLAAHVHQFLVRAAMLTAWTCWKLVSGAPWLKMNYGMALLRAQHLSLSPATSTDQDFTEWIAM